MRRPSSRISPASGLSSVPKRCSIVLLPQPEAPSTARNSPSCTSRSRPRSTSTFSALRRYTLCRFTALKSGWSVIDPSPDGFKLFVAQGPHGMQQGRPESRQHTEEHGNHDGPQVDVGEHRKLQIGRNLAEIVDVAIEELGAGDPCQEALDAVDVESEPDAQGRAARGADQAQSQAVAEKDLHDAA